MTPAARYQAAIEILDRILSGIATERALTAWARGARYAGSKDRAAIRDHVFDAVRCLRSHAALGGARTGRGLVLGGLRADGHDPDTVFSGAPYAPGPLSDAEKQAGQAPDGASRVDLPDWLWAAFQDSLGQDAEAAALALRHRAGIHLRVNIARSSRDAAVARLMQDGISAQPHHTVDTALIVTEGARRIRQSSAYLEGLVELQDAASQALTLALPLKPGQRVLDYCAGGGGKTLAMAARMPLDLFACDVEPARMRDLPSRAQRAGAQMQSIDVKSISKVPPFDLILCDAPCSGSGSWRRDPDGKWALTQERLRTLCDIQSGILDTTAPSVRIGGVLAYATCSVLAEENEDRVSAFLDRHAGWTCDQQFRWPIQPGTDGFFLALLTRVAA